MDQVGDHSDDVDWLEEISIKEAIAGLGEREKRILSLRFFTGKTQMEVAQEIGISQAQVSRLERVRWSASKSKSEENRGQRGRVLNLGFQRARKDGYGWTGESFF